jgi:hypothetical protein
MTTAVITPSVPPAPSPIDDGQVAVVEIPNDDVPPPGWDQWVSVHAPAPEPPTGALVVRDDGGAALGCPADGAGASSSCAALPASGGPASHPEQKRERAGAPPSHFVEAQAEQELWQELRNHGASLNRALNEVPRIHNGPAWHVVQVSGFSLDFVVSSPAFFHVRAFPDPFSSRLARRRQDLERWARERYDALDRLDTDLNWYRGQYNALDALAEALRSPDRWLVYQVEALLDQPPEQDAQAMEDASAVEKVRTALVERDDALCRARKDLAGAHSVATEWEAEVASARAQLQQDRATLEGGRPGRVRLRRGPRKSRG